MRRSGDSSPHTLTLHNAVLRELGLALGGPWEVSYVVTVSDPSGHTAADPVPRLLTAATPLTLDLDARRSRRPPAARASPGPTCARGSCTSCAATITCSSSRRWCWPR